MSLQFACPKCAQKLTLTSSKPGDWIDCPRCEATVQIPGSAPAQPQPQPAPRPASASARPPAPAEEPLDLPDGDEEPRSVWADKRAQVGVLVGGIGLLLVGLLVVVLVLQKPKKEPEQVRADPPTTQPAPAPVRPKEEPAPKVDPKVDPKIEPKVEPKVDPKIEPKVNPPKPAPNFSVLDQFGNPVDQNTGLGQQDEFKGQRLLFWCGYKGGGPEIPTTIFGPDNPLWKALGDKGFKVRREFGAFDPDWLKDADQCWLVAGSDSGTLNADAVAAITKFVDAGKGLCLLADNDPFVVEADQLARHLFGARVRGDYEATKIAYVGQRALKREEIVKYKGDYEVADHPLLAGVNFVYEGITISHIAESDALEVALKASNGKPVVALSKSPKRRVVIDCGFTRYYYHTLPELNFIEKTAGTTRLAQNMAAYLAGKDALRKP